ncbi:lipoprotein [Alphaproteobacteria bacterium]|nr:lipoprotein [Alphaproteobacteria bacterium]
MPSKKCFGLGIVLLISVLLSGCSNDFSGNTYSSANVGEVAKTESGIVVSLRRVEIKPDSKDLGVGALAGGVGGAAIGSAFGKGGGKTAAMIGGGLLGAAAGNAIQNRSKPGIEYIVKLDNGDLVTLAQGPEPAITVGQRVFVVKSEKGSSRIVPF